MHSDWFNRICFSGNLHLGHLIFLVTLILPSHIWLNKCNDGTIMDNKQKIILCHIFYQNIQANDVPYF